MGVSLSVSGGNSAFLLQNLLLEWLSKYKNPIFTLSRTRVSMTELYLRIKKRLDYGSQSIPRPHSWTNHPHPYGCALSTMTK